MNLPDADLFGDPAEPSRTESLAYHAAKVYAETGELEGIETEAISALEDLCRITIYERQGFGRNYHTEPSPF